MIKKMELNIENFRKHKKLSLIFNDNEIIHITGDVGSGKSTILNSIFWCLYGKLQEIADKTNPQEHKTIVSIYFNKLKLRIYRHNNPNYLEVIDNNIKYIGDAAQGVIINKFCNLDLWYISSYISQKNRHDFFNYSNKEKLKLLNQIAFKNVNIEDEKKKIETYYKNLNNDYEKRLYKFNIDYTNFQNDVSKKPYNPNFTKENLDNYLSVLSTYTNTEIELKKLLLIQEKLKGKFETLTNQKLYYTKQLNDLNFKENNINFDSEINNLENNIKNKEIIHNYNIELNKIYINDTLPKIDFSEKDYIDCKNYENIYYNEYLPLLNKYNFIKSQITNIIDINITQELLLNVKNNEDKINEKNKLLQQLNLYKLSNDEKELIVSWELYQKCLNQINIYNNTYLPLKLQYDTLKNNNYVDSKLISDNDILDAKNQEYKYNLYMNELNKYNHNLHLDFKNHNVNLDFSWDMKNHEDLINQWTLYNNEQLIISKMNELLLKIGDYRYNGQLTKEIIYMMREQKKLYLSEKDIIEKYNINKENISEIIKQIKNKIMYLENYNNIVTYNNLSSLKYDYNLNEINDLIAQLKISDKILKCPKCKENLVLKNNELEICNLNDKLDKISILKLEEDKIKLQKLEELKYKIKDINLNIEINKDDTIIKLNNDLNQIYNLKFIGDISYDIEKLEYILEYQNYYVTLRNIEKPKFSIDESIKMLKIMEIKNLKCEPPKISSLILQEIQIMQKCKMQLDELEKNGYNELPKYNPDKIKEIINYQELKNRIDMINIENYEYKYDELIKNYELKNLNIEKYNNYKEQPKYQSSYILNIIKNNENIDKRNKLIELGADGNDYGNEIIELKNKLIEIKKFEKEYNESKKMFDILNVAINNINVELENIKLNDKLGGQYEHVKNQIILINNAIEDCKYSLMMQEKYKLIVEEHEMIKNLGLDVAAASDLYKDAVSVECEHLQNIINSINNNLNIVYNKLYKYNIKVELKLTKKLKSKKKNKNEVNILIHYKGAEFKDISTLSGGEEDIIIFGLTVVLASMFDFPILMIDEYFKYINADYVECCVNVLKEYVNKTILIVSQKDIENRYDKVYDLDNIL